MKRIKVQAAILGLSLAMSLQALAADGIDDKKDNNISLSFSTSMANNKAIVAISNLEAENVATLKVTSYGGRLVYKEKVKGGNVFNKKYDFSQLAPGKYTIELQSNEEKFTERFSVGFNGVVKVYREEDYANFKPIVYEKTAAVVVCLQNTTNHPLQVNLNDANGKVVYSEWIHENDKYGKSFNLQQLKKGEYTIEVLGEDYAFQKQVSNL